MRKIEHDLIINAHAKGLDESLNKIRRSIGQYERLAAGANISMELRVAEVDVTALNSKKVKDAIAKWTSPELDLTKFKKEYAKFADIIKHQTPYSELDTQTKRDIVGWVAQYEKNFKNSFSGVDKHILKLGQQIVETTDAQFRNIYQSILNPSYIEQRFKEFDKLSAKFGLMRGAGGNGTGTGGVVNEAELKDLEIYAKAIAEVTKNILEKRKATYQAATEITTTVGKEIGAYKQLGQVLDEVKSKILNLSSSGQATASNANIVPNVLQGLKVDPEAFKPVQDIIDKITGLQPLNADALTGISLLVNEFNSAMSNIPKKNAAANFTTIVDSLKKVLDVVKVLDEHGDKKIDAISKMINSLSSLNNISVKKGTAENVINLLNGVFGHQVVSTGAARSVTTFTENLDRLSKSLVRISQSYKEVQKAAKDLNLTPAEAIKNADKVPTKVTETGSLKNVQEAAVHLISTEKTYQKLVAKSATSKFTQQDKIQLQELNKARERSNEILQASQSLINKESNTTLNKQIDKANASFQKTVDAYSHLGKVVGSLGNSTGDIRSLQDNIFSIAAGFGKVDEKSLSFAKLGNGIQQATIKVESADGATQKLIYSLDTLGNLHVNVASVTTGFGRLGKAVQMVGGIIKQYIGYSFTIYRVIGYFKQGITYVRELDKALTEHRLVTRSSAAAMKEMEESARDVAAEVAQTTTNVAQSATEWARLGYNSQDSFALARQAAIYAKTGFVEVEAATESLTSSIQAFKDTMAEDDVGKVAEDIVDKFVHIGNSYAITSAEIGDGLTRSAAALVAANNDINESIALITAGNTIMQDANAVSNAVKVLSMRLRGTSASALEEAGEDTEGLIEDASKLYETIKNLTKTSKNAQGVSILDANGDYRSTYEILLDIAEVWQDIGDAQRAALLETIAGKVRGAAAASILQNPELLKSIYEDSVNAAGKSTEAMEIALTSIDSKIEQLKNSWQTLWQHALNSDILKFFVDLINNIVKLIDNVGGLKVAFATLGAVAVRKGVGTAN